MSSRPIIDPVPSVVSADTRRAARSVSVSKSLSIVDANNARPDPDPDFEALAEPNAASKLH
jgi:hypothetical protein